MQEGARWRQCRPPTQYPKLFEISYCDIPKGLDVPEVIEYILKQIRTKLRELKDPESNAYMVSQCLSGVHVTGLPTDRKQELYHKLRPKADNSNILPSRVGVQEVTFIDTTTLGIILCLPKSKHYHN